MILKIISDNDEYQVEFQALCDYKDKKNIRVMFSIDNYSLRAWASPLTDDFLVSCEDSNSIS